MGKGSKLMAQTTEKQQPALFPGNYVLKVIGLATEEFTTVVLAILTKHIPELAPEAISYNKSQGAKYLAMSVTFYANNKAQVDALYQELTATPAVLMAL